MLGSNPSADSEASTDSSWGVLPHPPSAIRRLTIGRGAKALNPGGAGAKPPHAASRIVFCSIKGALP